jgi:hemerythrin
MFILMTNSVCYNKEFELRIYIRREHGMDGFEWNKDYDLGIPTIDGQHKELFQWIDKLTLSMYEGKGKEELLNVIEFLSSFVEEHFSYEEELMSRTPYPDLLLHKQKHREFINYFTSLKYEIAKRGADNFLAIKVAKEILSWWEEHESQYDRKYVPFVKKIIGN